MYSLYKYHEILEMEKEYQEHFAEINPCKAISVLPPVIRTYKGSHVLAFLVIPQPENHNHHLAVYRPIGAILRKIKSRKVVRIINCAEEEFIPSRNDFMIEYYDLESHPEYWPNRTPDNEETYRVALEKLLKVALTMKFGIYRKKLYYEYLNMIFTLFIDEYKVFFEAIAKNPITRINDEILYQRELAKKEHSLKLQKLKTKAAEDTALSYKAFIKNIKEHLSHFIRKEILPTLKNKPGYTKLDFFRFVGKMYRDLMTNDSKYLKCYDTTLTAKALDANQEDLKEKLKVSLIKTYAKACVKPLNTDENVNDVCNEIIKFMDTMLQQEVTQNVTDKSKEIIKMTMVKIERMINRMPVQHSKEEMLDVYEAIKNDYFNAMDELEMSDIYLGCMLTDIVI